MEQNMHYRIPRDFVSGTTEVSARTTLLRTIQKFSSVMVIFFISDF